MFSETKSNPSSNEDDSDGVKISHLLDATPFISWGDIDCKSFLVSPGKPDNGSTGNQSNTINYEIINAAGTPNGFHFPRDTSSTRYLIEEEIGRGGVGVILKGKDLQLNRSIAIKMLLEEHKDKSTVVHRFMEEARITSRLDHPGVVPIHEMGITADGRPFFVMQLIIGKTMDHALRVRTGTIDELQKFITIFLNVSQTIAYAHHCGVIHRDLKPANIMIGDFGIVHVMDWGLAKQIADTEVPEDRGEAGPADQNGSDESPSHKTQLGTVFGTPSYLPPEQARGEIDKVDRHADVFGLGSILCEILTGHPPYITHDNQTAYQQAASSDLTDALARLDACPAPLDLVKLTKWCLAPLAEDRPANAGVVVEVLTEYLRADQRRAEQDLIRFFELSLDLFCIASLDGYFLRINENFSKLLGFSEEELTSRPFLDFIHPDDREKTINECSALEAGGVCIHFQNRYRHMDGHYLWLEWNAQSVLHERAIYATARDVTFRKTNVE